MASKSLPSTPKPVSSSAPGSGASQTPGKWRHPRLDEIVRRQNASIFGPNNARRLLSNGVALITTWLFRDTLKAQLLRLHFLQDYPAKIDLAFFALQLYFTVNIVVALYPLFRPKDEMTDIPLTPTQRALLGLDPVVALPPTPESAYVTPPRYRLSVSRPASPFSTSPSPASARSLSSNTYSAGASFSPSTSPLLQRAIANGNKGSVQRPSFGSSPVARGSFWSSSPLAQDSSFKESTLSSWGPPTPSPTGRRGTGIGVTNKWLYERSGRLSTSNSAFSL